MMRAQQIVDLIVWRIGLLYHHRPLLYGGTAEGVETLLFYYHSLWAEIVGRVDAHWTAKHEISTQQDCGSRGFADKYSLDHPQASDDEVVKYVVAQWRKISDLSSVPIPHEAIIEDLAKDFGPDQS